MKTNKVKFYLSCFRCQQIRKFTCMTSTYNGEGNTVSATYIGRVKERLEVAEGLLVNNAYVASGSKEIIGHRN